MTKQNKTHGIKKFSIILAILLGYAAYVIFHFGVRDGLAVTMLTWAFFVTCTPVADAGFLVDFPVRVVLGLKMIWSELIVWGLAGLIIMYYSSTNQEIFNSSTVLELLRTILANPWPLWSIILVSATGTFLSVYVGDQIYTLVQRHNHHEHIKKLQIQRVAIEAILLAVVIMLYYLLFRLADAQVL